jgi:MFS family permease
MTIGLIVWALATIVFGIFADFWPLLIFHVFTGVGEAAFIATAPAVVVDTAPASKKTTYLGILMAIAPAGVAFGFIFGEAVSQAFGSFRYPFFFLGLIMGVQILVFVFSYKDPKYLVRGEAEINAPLSVNASADPEP